ncbi:hypothetical protein [uncultured Paludibaculum sp.]|uniref:hypothetical protein n=1 Tax=uncultured Paludibaculum sp. TaxID=1765020 RepID=UPI002AABEA32|nr:hypothetical protein [uncultured Paludibaculum sp.]
MVPRGKVPPFPGDLLGFVQDEQRHTPGTVASNWQMNTRARTSSGLLDARKPPATVPRGEVNVQDDRQYVVM